MRPKIILMSHGHMAEETLKSAQMIVGETSDVYTVAMLEEDGLSGTNEKLDALLHPFGKEVEVLILADLKGGTPGNVALMKMAEYPSLRVVTGLNLAMTIEAIFSTLSTAEELASMIEDIGKGAVEKLQPLVADDDDEEYEE